MQCAIRRVQIFYQNYKRLSASGGFGPLAPTRSSAPRPTLKADAITLAMVSPTFKFLLHLWAHAKINTCTLCLKKVPTIKLSVTLSNLNQFSKFLHCWKAYETCYKTYKTLPISPSACCYTTLGN